MKKLFFCSLSVLILLCGVAGNVNAQVTNYNADEVRVLKDFLKQGSATPGENNGIKLGIIDIDQWDPATTDQKMKWTTTPPKRLKEILWSESAISGSLDLSLFDSVKNIECNGNKLKEIIFPDTLYDLQKVMIARNQLTELVLPKNAPLLMSVLCNQNHLTKLEIPDSINKLKIVMVSGNRLKYSTLPKLLQSTVLDEDSYSYYPQDTIKLEHNVQFIDFSAEFTVTVGEQVDTTTFEWMYLDDAGVWNDLNATSYVTETGKFLFSAELTQMRLQCVMKNNYFPELTQIAIVEPDPSIYDTTEVAAMKDFFRQIGKAGTITNGEELGVMNIDTWNPRSSAANLTWDNSNPKHIVTISWIMKAVAGTLDLSKCDSLQRVELNRTGISELKFAENTHNLKYIYCPESKLTSLTLPNIAPKLNTVQCYTNKLAELTLPTVTDTTIEIMVHGNKLTSFIIPESIKNNIYLLWLHNNQLTELTMPDSLPKIRYFYLRGNNLSKCVLPENMKALDHFWIDSNAMRFSTLPRIEITGNYYHASQDTIQITAGENKGIDLSAESTVTISEVEHSTIYKWFELAANKEVVISKEDYTEENGKFIFKKQFGNNKLRCKMTNENFPDLTLVADVTISANIESIKNTDKKLNIYPNPATDQVKIGTEIFKESTISISIIDFSGRSCLNKIVQNSNDGILIPLEGMAPGTYVIKANTTKQSAMGKLIVK